MRTIKKEKDLMRPGKVESNIKKRSIENILSPVCIHDDTGEGKRGPAFSPESKICEEDGCFRNIVTGQTVSLSDSPYKIEGAFYRALGKIYEKGADVLFVEDVLILPESTTEHELKGMIKTLSGLSEKTGVKVAGGHTTVSGEVLTPVIVINATGYKKETVTKTAGTTEEKADILITGHIAMEASAYLAFENEEKLKKRLHYDIVEKAKGFMENLSVKEAALIAAAHKASVKAVSEGGILCALHEFFEKYETGFDIDMRKIPIYQETIEICEYLRYNPYKMLSGGCLIIMLPNRGIKVHDKEYRELESDLEAAGINYVRVGNTTVNKARILRNKDEISYLNRPDADEYIIRSRERSTHEYEREDIISSGT